jgi:hypothetical protein
VSFLEGALQYQVLILGEFILKGTEFAVPFERSQWVLLIPTFRFEYAALCLGLESPRMGMLSTTAGIHKIRSRTEVIEG